MNMTLTDEADLEAKWTYDPGHNVSRQFSSDWGGILVTSGDDNDNEKDDWHGAICVSDDEEEKEFVLTTYTYRDSINGHDSGGSPPPAPNSPTDAGDAAMSPMERARLAMSKKELTKSARSQQKTSLKLKLDTLTFTGPPLDI
ncbi:unnamed protein product [Cylindrotheca closterium]|uniref:Uncharacterized protein n=1 Tax=Cylindrotheca closterium TaxID=2856 RepID=A0AAD2FI95_9STRA|nr:unnamed protein product [Cylindrotheca closterium]